MRKEAQAPQETETSRRREVYEWIQALVCSVLTVVLLWDRYVNKGLLPVGRDGCFVAALFLFGLAWLNYLRLDGLEVPHLLTGKNRPEKKKKRRRPDRMPPAIPRSLNARQKDSTEQKSLMKPYYITKGN